MELNEDIALIKKLERYFRHHYNDTTIDWRDEFKYTLEDIKLCVEKEKQEDQEDK